VYVSLAVNGLLLAVVLLVVLRDYSLSAASRSLPTPSVQSNLLVPVSTPTPELGPRHQLTYQQWVDLLRQEAKAAAEANPQRLTVLVGDSLSLWFPPELLPAAQTWLNQGISGETSAGLLKRLDLFEQTQPETILVMIGINDLIRQVRDETLLANHRQILRTLRQQHPDAQIVLQSILPHGGAQASWEGRDRLLAISNDHIRQLNQELQTIAIAEEVDYLDLHPLFSDAQGNLHPELSTDGLHLSRQGYLVWRTALQMREVTKNEE
jgi:lysophospholipase L1-like esterase